MEVVGRSFGWAHTAAKQFCEEEQFFFGRGQLAGKWKPMVGNLSRQSSETSSVPPFRRQDKWTSCLASWADQKRMHL